MYALGLVADTNAAAVVRQFPLVLLFNGSA